MPSKWSLSQFQNYVIQNKIGGIFKYQDYEKLFEKIHDLIIKTIIAVEPLLQNGKEMYLPEDFAHPPKSSNCFELLGFDVLLDENLKPWLLEVNLSPSLNTESSLDIKIKTKMLVDLFNMVGISHH